MTTAEPNSAADGCFSRTFHTEKQPTARPTVTALAPVAFKALFGGFSKTPSPLPYLRWSLVLSLIFSTWHMHSRRYTFTWSDRGRLVASYSRTAILGPVQMSARRNARRGHARGVGGRRHWRGLPGAQVSPNLSGFRTCCCCLRWVFFEGSWLGNVVCGCERVPTLNYFFIMILYCILLLLKSIDSYTTVIHHICNKFYKKYI